MIKDRRVLPALKVIKVKKVQMDLKVQLVIMVKMFKPALKV